MSLKQRLSWFVRELNFPKARPNPKGYPESHTFWSVPNKKKVILESWATYRQGWETEFGTTKEAEAKEKEEWERTLKEQSHAIKDVATESTQVIDETKNYLTHWVTVYRDTLEQFSKGYRRGLDQETKTSGK